MTRWRINPGFNEVALVPARAPAPPEGRRMSSAMAAGRVNEWFPDTALGPRAHRLSEICRTIDGPTAGRESRDAQRRRVRAALDNGRLIAFRIPNKLSGEYLAPPEEEGESEERARRTHTVAFVFQYPDQSPFGDVDYVWIPADGERSDRTLPANGEIEEQDVPYGNYVVELKEVDAVSWGAKSALCDDEIAILARTSGFADGTSATVRVFRELAEAEGEHIATLTGEVAANQVEVMYKHDYNASEDDQRRSGIESLIAEVEVEGSWAKTTRPLALELKSILSARWASRRAQEGEPLGFDVRTLGFADGTPVELKVLYDHPLEDDVELESLSDVTVQNGRAHGVWPCDLSAIPFTEDREAKPVYFVAGIEDGVERSLPSGRARCRHATETEGAS